MAAPGDRRGGLLLGAALVVLLLAVSARPAAAAENPWLGQRLLNFAHQGGEFEHPSNTMYAFKRAHQVGADVLELDIHTTEDGQIVVIHDSTVDRTTNGSGSVYDMTLAELRKLDAAHNFIPGRNAVRGQPGSAYPFRGVRTGKRPPPRGYTRDDFRIPTLREVFRAFPDTPINIEIKGESDADPTTYLRNAEVLAAFLNAARRTDLIVVSFHDEATDRFHQLAPQIPTAPGLAKVAAYVQGAPLGGDYDALQVPPSFQGITVVTPEFVRRAHDDGYAVHVWIDSSEEYDSFYADQFGMCVDAIMTAYPERLEGAMRRRRYMRPGRGGIDPCGRDRPQIAPCTLRAARLGRAGRRNVKLNIRRLDAWRDGCRGSVRLRAGHKTIARGKLSVGLDARAGRARLRLSRTGRRLLRRQARLKVVARLRVEGVRRTPRRVRVLKR